MEKDLLMGHGEREESARERSVGSSQKWGGGPLAHSAITSSQIHHHARTKHTGLATHCKFVTRRMATPSRSESEQEVRSWGFETVYTWTDGPYVIPPPPSSQVCIAGA
jgi:hypothetical protein